MGYGRALRASSGKDEEDYIAERHINFYTIDGIKIGKEIGLGGRINTVLQSAFFKLADIIPAERLMSL